MANSNSFRESMALAAAALATHLNLHTGDPGTTGAAESAGARSAITWTGGTVDGTVAGAEITATHPAGVYTYASLFSGSTGSNYLTSYLLPAAVVLSASGPVKITPQYVFPA